MVRVVFANNQLKQYLDDIQAKSGLSLPQLAKIIGVDRHTLNDWKRGKLMAHLETLQILSTKFSLFLPYLIETQPDTWGCSKAAHIRQQKYGCTLTHEDRVKAGTNSQQRRRERPDYYASFGCNVPQTFALPIHKSIELAELVGILLGDGGIQEGQLIVTLNSIKDQQYSLYVSSLFQKLFMYTPTIAKRKNCNAITLSVSGGDIIKYLLSIGLRVGNKVRQQVDVPNWIKDDPDYCRWCLRGLMDTDGGIFTHTYIIANKTYSYLKSNFTNASLPLLNFANRTLIENGFHPSSKQPRRVWLYSQAESRRYIKVIGSSNSRLFSKFQ